MKKRIFLIGIFVSLFFSAAKAQTSSYGSNIDFELGDYSTWQYYTGSCCPGGSISASSVTIPSPPTFLITSGSGVDSFGLFPIVGAGSYSLRIGNRVSNSLARKASYSIHIPASTSNYDLIYRYAAVLEDAGHPVAQESRMTINVTDSASGTSIANVTMTAGSVPGFIRAVSVAGPTTDVYYKPWTTQAVNLAGYNGSTIVVEVATAGCALGGHFGYGYFDMGCGLFAISSVSNCVSSQLIAPAGFASYAWYDSATFSTPYGTNDTISVPASTSIMHYAVIATPGTGFGSPDTFYTTVYPSSCSSAPAAGVVSTTMATACGTTPFTLSATGYTTGIYYQWQSSPDSLTWSNIAGATANSYTQTGITATTYYRFKDSCCSGTFTSVSPGVKIIYVTACPCILNAGTVVSSAATACATASVTLTNSTYTSTGTTVQWQSSADSATWFNIVGATSGSYATTGITTTTYYRLVVTCTSSGMSLASAGKKIIYTVSCACSGLTIAGTATASTTYCSSCALILDLTGYSSSTGLTFQWQSSPNNTTWSNIAGATTLPYTYMPSSSYYYRCKVACPSGGTAYSSSIYVIAPTHIVADSVCTPPDSLCNTPKFYLKINGTSSLLRLKTYYGDGTEDSIAFIIGSTSSYANASHAYTSPGYYTIKQIVYDNNIPQDSIRFTYHQNYCKTFQIKLYLDVNGDCIKNATEGFNTLPVSIRVDSAGIAICTLSTTSGLYYKAKGGPGTVYTFNLLPSSSIYPSCPSSGVIYDTIMATASSYPVKYIGFNCVTTTDYDLLVLPSMRCGTHMGIIDIIARNNYCTPENATLTLELSPKYHTSTSMITPTPLSVIGNTITWMFSGFSSSTTNIQLYLSTPTLLSIGDTVHDYYSITPIIGDVNPGNNTVTCVDTLKGGYDPNYINVTPSGCFTTDTQFQYVIHFENTGNDTAHNIYVLDTLSDNIDATSLKILAATAEMDVYQYNDGGYNIIKFDFPNINLLDSSHHGLCDGAVAYTVNRTVAMPDGAIISGRAGIYFDINPVVMTNTVENVKGCPTTNVPVVGTNKVEIYPNPTTDELTIKMEQNAYTSFIITNSIGQTLMQNQLNGTQTKVSVKTLPPGLYYVTVKGDNGSKVQKFVKL